MFSVMKITHVPDFSGIHSGYGEGDSFSGRMRCHCKKIFPDPVFTTTLSASVAMIFTSIYGMTGRPRLVSPTAVLAGLMPVAVALGGTVMKIYKMATLIFQPLAAFVQQVSGFPKRICGMDDGLHACSVGWYAGDQSM